MTASMLELIAARLYGPQWQTPLAKALPRNVRSVRRYVSTGRVPESVQARLRKLIDEAQCELKDLAAVMDGNCPNRCGALGEDDGVPVCDRCGWFWRGTLEEGEIINE